ncbi:MarR family transcriptional regulator [Streptomyces sp. NPDC090053]|uniref:MarR family transcriptional regulator n=1 Tax=Streptomyces sp. NPDC090053 TaxID=3365932 RepID=UPI0037F29910
MATENHSSALHAPASSRPHPKANHGYGKRSASDQLPPCPADFTMLPERERYIAGYVDRLPDGAAMDIKMLAKNIPLYGQMAVGSALKALTVAGYLRRAQCRTGGSDSRWVTLTYWSRTARDNEWWDAFAEAENHRVVEDVTAAEPEVPPPWAQAEAPVEQVRAEASVALPAPTAPVLSVLPVPSVPSAPSVPQQRTAGTVAAPDHSSPAYLALASLGRTDPRLALSAADCAVLEPLAAAWLDRGVNPDYLTHTLSSGLPAQVGSPVGFVRRRLRDKIPPHLPAIPAPAAPGTPVQRRLLLECTECGAPGPSGALPDGLCRPCRTSAQGLSPTAAVDVPAERDIHALVGNLRHRITARGRS